MGPASVIYNGLQVPLGFNPSLLRVSPTSPLFQDLKWSRVQFSYPRIPILYAVGCRCRRFHYTRIACSRGIEEEEGLCNSGETSSSELHDGVYSVDTSRNTPDGNLEEKYGGPENYKSSVRTVALWVCAAVAFGVGLGLKDGVGRASEFFAGYLLEQSLSVDNLFVFVLVFKYFKVPIMYQSRVLSYGIAGAIIFRLSLILLGTAALQRFEAVNLFFAAILLYSSFKLFSSEDEDTDLSNNFVVKTCQKFIPVTSNYDGNRFITVQNGVWKESNILGRLHLYFSQ